MLPNLQYFCCNTPWKKYNHGSGKAWNFFSYFVSTLLNLMVKTALKFVDFDEVTGKNELASF